MREGVVSSWTGQAYWQTSICSVQDTEIPWSCVTVSLFYAHNTLDSEANGHHHHPVLRILFCLCHRLTHVDSLLAIQLGWMVSHFETQLAGLESWEAWAPLFMYSSIWASAPDVRGFHNEEHRSFQTLYHVTFAIFCWLK